MDITSITRERIVALCVVVAQVIAAIVLSESSRNPAFRAVFAAGLCVPGLLIIWFREGLSMTGFDRGVLRESPPLLLDVFGWLFLIVMPVIFLYNLLP